MTRRGLQAIVSRLQQGKASVGDWQAMFKVREPQNLAPNANVYLPCPTKFAQ